MEAYTNSHHYITRCRRPSLIIVRVSLGIAIDDEQSFKDTIARDFEATQGHPSSHGSLMDIRRLDDSEVPERDQGVVIGDAKSQEGK